MIHNICNKLRLKHKSHGKGANRRLTVWKDEVSVSDWIMDVPVTEFAEEEEEGLELHTVSDTACRGGQGVCRISSCPPTYNRHIYCSD